jgi:hypothetical protein
MTGSYKQVEELSVSLRGGEIVDQLNNYQLVNDPILLGQLNSINGNTARDTNSFFLLTFKICIV